MPPGRQRRQRLRPAACSRASSSPSLASRSRSAARGGVSPSAVDERASACGSPPLRQPSAGGYLCPELILVLEHPGFPVARGGIEGIPGIAGTALIDLSRERRTEASRTHAPSHQTQAFATLRASMAGDSALWSGSVTSRGMRMWHQPVAFSRTFALPSFSHSQMARPSSPTLNVVTGEHVAVWPSSVARDPGTRQETKALASQAHGRTAVAGGVRRTVSTAARTIDLDRDRAYDDSRSVQLPRWSANRPSLTVPTSISESA